MHRMYVFFHIITYVIPVTFSWGGFFVLWQECSKKALMSLLVGQTIQFSTVWLEMGASFESFNPNLVCCRYL